MFAFSEAIVEFMAVRFEFRELMVEFKESIAKSLAAAWL